MLNKSQEQGLNLSRSWHKGTLSCLQYPVLYLSRLQRICLPAIFELIIQHIAQRDCFVAGWNLSHVMILGSTPKGGLFVLMITQREQHITAFQHGFGLRGVQPFTYTW